MTALGLDPQHPGVEQATEVRARGRGRHVRCSCKLAGGEGATVQQRRHEVGPGAIREQAGGSRHVDIHISTVSQLSRP